MPRKRNAPAAGSERPEKAAKKEEPAEPIKKQLKLFYISQDAKTGWDIYLDAVVAAPTEQEAVKIHPDGVTPYETWANDQQRYPTWCKPGEVECMLIGTANDNIKEGVVCANFRAG